MSDFHLMLTGSVDSKVIDEIVEPLFNDFVKAVENAGVKIEGAAVSAGHFLGGTHHIAHPDLVKTVETPAVDSVPAETSSLEAND